MHTHVRVDLCMYRVHVHACTPHECARFLAHALLNSCHARLTLLDSESGMLRGLTCSRGQVGSGHSLVGVADVALPERQHRLAEGNARHSTLPSDGDGQLAVSHLQPTRSAGSRVEAPQWRLWGSKIDSHCHLWA